MPEEFEKKLSTAYERTKGLSFLQSMGREAMPSQLNTEEASKELRLGIWERIHGDVKLRCRTGNYSPRVLHKSDQLLFGYVYQEELFIPSDEHSFFYSEFIERVKPLILDVEPLKFYASLDRIVRYSGGNTIYVGMIKSLLELHRSAYRVYGNPPRLIPIDETTLKQLADAFTDAEELASAGVAIHLQNSATKLSEGEYENSVRESINAVESLTRKLTGKNTLGLALKKLGYDGVIIHRQLISAFEKLYSWTNANEGIRHPLIDENEAGVTEAEAIFMIGVCSSICSYLIRKGRDANLID